MGAYTFHYCMVTEPARWTVPNLVCGIGWIQQPDITVYKNLRFHRYARVQENGVFKNLRERSFQWVTQEGRELPRLF